MNLKHMKRPKPKKIEKKRSTGLVKGKLDIAKNGFGYVSVSDRPIDILIKRDSLRGAMSGDEVEVSILESRPGKRIEGIITRVLKRSQLEFIGTLQLNKGFAFVVPDNQQFTKDIYIDEKDCSGVTDGDRVLVRIIDWSERMKNPQGKIIEVLTASRTNDLAMKEILLQAGFPLQFSEEALNESRTLSGIITADELAKRKDLRQLLTFTIDPFDARDFDDAISFQQLQNGHYEIGVHIADVSHFVKPGTALDKEAQHRATSVYLPDRVLPMLPETISNELCSLRPHEDKLTFSVLFEINDEAKVMSHWIGKTIIHSDRRFTYEDVQEIIETGKGDHQEVILCLHRITQIIRKQKFEEGAINFASEEVRFILDENGVPIDVMVKQSKASHQLIEELMLLANRTVSEYAAGIRKNKKSIPFPYRVHDTPDIDKLKSFAAFAARYGHTFDLSSPEGIASSFNRMIIKSANDPAQEILHTLGIRTMAKAHYTTENIGHYGLGFEYYSHFTSPIRRYPDVLCHRLLFSMLEKEIQPIPQLEELCVHCSERERKAMEAEREGNKYKQVEFMSKFLGDEFEAVISGVSAYGFWAQTIQHKCEGFVSAQDLLEWDEFKFSESDYALVGRNSKVTFQMGNVVTICVVSANLSRRQLDYAWVNPKGGKKKIPVKRQGNRKKR
jgi:ribonuclease R